LSVAAVQELPVSTTPDTPEFAVKVDGTLLDRAQRDSILRLDVHEEIGHLARAVLLVRNWDDDEQVTELADGPFAAGAEVELQLGYGDQLEVVFDGIITGRRARFVSGDSPVAEIQCRCRGALLAVGERSRVLEEATDADVASAVAGDHGLSAQAETGASQPFAVQAAQTDWELLRARAERLGWALYVRGTDLIFHPPDAGAEAAVTLGWGANVVELDLEEDTGGRVAAITASAWDPSAVEAATADGTGTADEPPQRLASSAALAADELSARAEGAAKRDELRRISGRGRAIGMPQLRCDATLALEGCGDPFDGTHYVSAVRHVLDASGFSTEFQLGLPAPLGPAAAASTPLPGLSAGVVDDIDDPDGQGRVRVLLPWLDDSIPSVWARLAVPAAGGDRGFFFVPEVGDEVLVGFLSDDPRHPVVLGGVWNGTQAPPESLDASTNAIRSIVSRSGHRITLDDSDGAAKVVVQTAEEQKITMDDTAGIELEDKSGNKLTMASAGITLEAASGADVVLKSSSGKVSIDAMQLAAKASASAKIESSATLDLQASATLGLKGSLVNLG
jgi:Rhs element Vgr protein